MEEHQPKQRTGQQNRALWVFFTMVADALNDAGYTQKKVFEKAQFFDVQCDKDFVHDIWCHFQEAKFGTDKTRDLIKQGQIEEVHEYIMQKMGEIFGIEYIPFPNKKEEAPLIDDPY